MFKVNCNYYLVVPTVRGIHFFYYCMCCVCDSVVVIGIYAVDIHLCDVKQIIVSSILSGRKAVFDIVRLGGLLVCDVVYVSV